MMTPEQLSAIRERAQPIVDGFKRPSEQCARDVLKLLALVSAQQAKLDKFEREAAAKAFSDLGGRGTKGGPRFGGDEYSVFREMFGEDFFRGNPK